MVPVPPGKLRRFFLNRQAWGPGQHVVITKLTFQLYTSGPKRIGKKYSYSYPEI